MHYPIHVIGTYNLSMEAGEIVRTYKSYVGAPCFLYSMGVFVFIKYTASRITSVKIWEAVGALNKYTFSLYLMQWFFFFIVDNYTSIDKTSMWYRLDAPYLVFLMVIGITYMFRKIPIIKWIVP